MSSLRSRALKECEGRMCQKNGTMSKKSLGEKHARSTDERRQVLLEPSKEE